MERKRKSFCYLTTKVYQGEKTLGIRFEPKQDKEVIKFVRAILQAAEYGKGIDITIFKYKPLKSGLVRITVTARK